MSGNNLILLVVMGGVPDELEDLDSKVLEDGHKVDWGTSAQPLGIAVLQEPGDPSHGELEGPSPTCCVNHRPCGCWHPLAFASTIVTD